MGGARVSVPETVGYLWAGFGGRGSPSERRRAAPRPAPTDPSRPYRSMPTASAQNRSASRLRYPLPQRGLCKSNGRFPDARPPDIGAKVVRDHRISLVIAREIAEPLHESIRIATSASSPRTCPVSASVATPMIAFSPFTRTTVSSAPVTLTRPRACPVCLRRAFRPASWTSRRALMRDTETPKAAAGGSRSAATVRAPTRAPPWGCPPRSPPSGQC